MANNSSSSLFDVVANSDGRLAVFVVGPGGILWHLWQTAPGGGWWQSSQLDTGVREVVATSNADSRLEVFTIGTDGNLWHQWQTSPGGGWSTAAQLDTQDVHVAVARNADGRLEVFMVAPDSGLWHMWQTSPGGGWSQSSQLDTGVREVVTISNADGRLEVFTIGTDGNLWHQWQTSPGGGWSTAAQLDTQDVHVAVARNADGRLETFMLDPCIGLWHMGQQVSGNPWSSTEQIWTAVLAFTMQPQQQSNWCWAALTSSVSHFYNAASSWTQCGLANAELGQTTCCAAGGTAACNRPWYVKRALTRTGNLRDDQGSTTTFQALAGEVLDGRPVGVCVAWSGGGGHALAVVGCGVGDIIIVADPIFGTSVLSLSTFQSNYQGSGTWDETAYTKG